MPQQADPLDASNETAREPDRRAVSETSVALSYVRRTWLRAINFCTVVLKLMCVSKARCFCGLRGDARELSVTAKVGSRPDEECACR